MSPPPDDSPISVPGNRNEVTILRATRIPPGNQKLKFLLPGICEFYRQIHPSETAAVSSLAREVFDKFVAPHYETEGVLSFTATLLPRPFRSDTSPVTSP